MKNNSIFEKTYFYIKILTREIIINVDLNYKSILIYLKIFLSLKLLYFIQSFILFRSNNILTLKPRQYLFILNVSTKTRVIIYFIVFNIVVFLFEKR